jgi:hypothetical protein
LLGSTFALDSLVLMDVRRAMAPSSKQVRK